jgi:sulfur relay (sulfurtransferase) DsrF/TusC family protein
VPEAKSLLFVLTSAPHGRINAQEGLDALLMGSAFADCSALFLGDGILQLID